MAKKAAPKKKEEPKAIDQMHSKLPIDVQEKLEKIKVKLDKFKKEIVTKFDKYIMGIALAPPPKPLPPLPGQPPAPAPDKNKVHILVLVDDSDSKKMSKWELKDKLSAIIVNIAKDLDPNLVPQTIILSELWQSCYDGKTDLLQTIALSAPVHDTGMLAAIKIAEIHKNMVLKKFERYIVSYVLAGSLTQGRATPTSDIDVWIVIDDTDVKKMTRAELKDKIGRAACRERV